MKNFLIHLLNYELWANQRVIQALESLDKPPARAVAVMGHILAVQQVWLGRVEHETIFVSIWEDTPISWMEETAQRQHRKIVSYISSLSEPELLLPVDYTTAEGESYKSTLVDILTHMSHHAAYHRGQVVQLIRPLMTEAPVTDFIVWSHEA
ncbi:MULTISPECIES: DinB family protein [Spirosoma]|uniref:Damage-inducible protein DinB n=1 Tax=Spirosoma sordidisoli TaxID=2502893 RepID=A0A4Q2UQ61_9BACT|nr:MULTISPECIES: DinB family protein [Spirosoma]RYC68929.1 damage-inducible protein DinB [Spirosoma sordidisoli]